MPDASHGVTTKATWISTEAEDFHERSDRAAAEVRRRFKKQIPRLDIWSKGRRVGELLCGATANGDTVYRFQYAPGTPPELAISLTMQVREEPYTSTKLFPPFEKNIPEMNLGQFPAWMQSDYNLDVMGLLAASGNRLLSHLRVAAPGKSPTEWESVPLTLKSLFDSNESGEDLFVQLVSQCAHIPGVSGVQPKLLVEVDHAMPFDKTVRTLRMDTHILKSAAKPEHRGITVAEYCALRAAASAGLPAAEAILSHDGTLLAVERFDVVRDKDGETRKQLVLEEMCQLLGKASSEKYSGKCEDLARAVVAVNQRDESVRNGELEQLFRLITFNYAIQNGDAHLKNFGILYEQGSAKRKLAPVYDVLTTAPFLYSDRLQSDIPAMTLAGGGKWNAWEDLAKFGATSCRLSPTRVQEIMQEVVHGVQGTIPLIDTKATTYPEFAEKLNRIADTWKRATGSLQRYLERVAPAQASGAAAPSPEGVGTDTRGTSLSL